MQQYRLARHRTLAIWDKYLATLVLMSFIVLIVEIHTGLRSSAHSSFLIEHIGQMPSNSGFMYQREGTLLNHSSGG